MHTGKCSVVPQYCPGNRDRPGRHVQLTAMHNKKIQAINDDPLAPLIATICRNRRNRWHLTAHRRLAHPTSTIRPPWQTDPRTGPKRGPQLPPTTSTTQSEIARIPFTKRAPNTRDTKNAVRKPTTRADERYDIEVTGRAKRF
jgi:hypothetical protein